ncbi:hypothetical protein BH23THE1_BH23THE1_21120 [soil metagenome]
MTNATQNMIEKNLPTIQNYIVLFAPSVRLSSNVITDLVYSNMNSKILAKTQLFSNIEFE